MSSFPARTRHSRRDWFGVFCKSFAYLWALVLLYPILYLVSLSLRPNSELADVGFSLIPNNVRWANYEDAFTLMSSFVISIPQLLLNSVMVVGAAIAGTLIIAVLASYAFATMAFRGRRLLFYLVLHGLVVPIPVMLIPEFAVVREYGLIGTRLSLILPYIAFGLPLPILILTTFFKELPRELIEAAELDGASHMRVLSDIVLPIARPALATCVIFLALAFWNEFPLALVMIQNPELATVPLGLASVQGKGFSPWELIAAVMLITSLPVVILFIVFQRQFIEGLLHGALKG